MYKDFRVSDSTIPYFLMHVRAQPETYDLKLYAHTRKFFFKPLIESQIYEKLRAYLWQFFNKLHAQSEPKSLASKPGKFCFYEIDQGDEDEMDEHNESNSGF